jgi:hypothetical protein
MKGPTEGEIHYLNTDLDLIGPVDPAALVDHLKAN